MFILEKDKNSFFFRHYFVIFDLSWRWMVFGLRRFSEVKSCVCTYTLCLFDKVQICLFRLFSWFFTFGDLSWPGDWLLFQICDLRWPLMTSRLLLESRRPDRHFDIYFIIYYRSSKFALFRNFWPRVTFVDLVIPFFEKLTSRASFSYTIYPLSKTFENWPFFGIFDLRWSLLTSWPLFLKSWRQERHFDIQFTHFQWLLKFDPEWPQICNLTSNPKLLFLKSFLG